MTNNDIEIMPQDIADALRSRDYSACHDDRAGTDWSLGPIIAPVDSQDLVTVSNADALGKALKASGIDGDTYRVVGARVSFLALDANEEPTEIFQFLHNWEAVIEEHVIADSADYSRRENEALEMDGGQDDS